MKSSISPFHFALAGLLFLAATGLSLQAQPFSPPNGTFMYSSSSFNPKVYDLTGTYDFEQEVELDDGSTLCIQFIFNIVQDPRGKIFGTGPTTMLINDEYDVTIATIDSMFEVKGSIKGANDVTSVGLKLDAYGFGSLFGTMQEVGIKMNYRLVVDGPNEELVGTGKGKAGASEEGVVKVQEDRFELDIDNGSDGDWMMVLNLTPDGKKLTGNGQLMINPALTIGFTAKGSWKEKDDMSKIQIKGTNVNKSSSLKFEVFTENADLGDLKGKILNQKIIQIIR